MLVIAYDGLYSQQEEEKCSEAKVTEFFEARFKEMDNNQEL